MFKNSVAVLVALLAVSGCSSVGVGFANHPADCALGIAWDDCLPGTPGYARGGGRIHREAEAAQLRAKNEEVREGAQRKCDELMAGPSFDRLRGKLQLQRVIGAAVPFVIASNDQFPQQEDLPALASWADARQTCAKADFAAWDLQRPDNSLQLVQFDKVQSIIRALHSHVDELVLSLYRQKLTWGEFAKRRAQVEVVQMDAANNYRENILSADLDRRAAAAERAERNAIELRKAMAMEAQAIAARAPKTVIEMNPISISCQTMSLGSGNSVTNCN